MNTLADYGALVRVVIIPQTRTSRDRSRSRPRQLVIAHSHAGSLVITPQGIGSPISPSPSHSAPTWGDKHGTYILPEAGPRTQYVQNAGPWGHGSLRLWYVPNAGGW